MTFLAPLLARFIGLPSWLRYLIAGIAAGLLVWGAFGLWLHFHDAKVIADDTATANVEKAEAITEADRAANAKGAERVDALAKQQEKLNEAAKQGDDTLAGNGVRSVLGELRRAKKD